MSAPTHSPVLMLVLTMLLSSAAIARPACGAVTVLDAFEDASVWKPLPASGVQMRLSVEPGETGNALRVDFDFQKGGGYAVLQRPLALELPPNYRFRVRVKGATAPQTLEFKLLDPSGENVWWKNRRDFVFPRTWETVTTKQRQIEFAWGPAGGGPMKRVAAIEFAITAGSGGKGTVWFDELSFEELAAPSATPPPLAARASSSVAGFAASRAADADSSTAWRSSAQDAAPWLELDLGAEREFGGLKLQWEDANPPGDYDVRLSSDGVAWRTAREVRGGNGGTDWLSLPESEARLIRIATPSSKRARARSIGLADVSLLALELGASANAFYERIARTAPRGHYPRGMRGEMQFWSVVGSAGGGDESFVSEDGAVDLGTGQPSIEPFLWVDHRLWTWADVRSAQTLRDGRLPIPSVTWSGAPVELTVTAAPMSAPELPGLRTLVVYRVVNRSATRRAGTLFLAARPFQVNPPAQFLNQLGGVAPLATLARVGDRIDLGEGASVHAAPSPTGWGAATYDAGDVVEYLARGVVPHARAVRDPFARASGALAYAFDLRPGDSLRVALELDHPRSADATLAPEGPGRVRVSSWVTPLIEGEVRDWSELLGSAEIRLPPSAREVERSLAAQIAWIHVNRDGPAIQPGSRAYARSWIRDGSLTSSALLRWGQPEPVKRFLEWFAPFQYGDGKVPCCVDARGSDPVPEHDSHGQFIYLLAEYLRHTDDRTTAAKLWPHALAAAGYIDSLRHQRLGAQWRARSRAEFFGILPPSISHEGYSAKPMHSYWDDFWALQGLEDAVYLGETLGHPAAARHIDSVRAAFRRDFAASIRATQRRHRIGYVPGCADLGDFDATSTTIAVSPVQAMDVAPPGTILNTFERYWDFFRKRRDGREKWEAFTPYEIRNVGAFVRLGWRDRAQELLSWFLEHRSPAGWAQWAEVVWNAPDRARFVGDIPHTWVGSDYVRSVLDLFAFERERDDALVIGAGIPDSWLREGEGVAVRDLNTWYGRLSYRMRAEGRGVVVEIAAGPRIPRGGLVVAAPGIHSRSRATLNGKSLTITSQGEVVVRSLPATVLLTP
ncbi:MAG: coagulation factor 5/8 type domain-containing protein [Candidatus Eisenbacteria bacterium]|uniref:Coagulation factor 5/8 type domain-containing protein n=1 Tax=Eiseniibacteriota bacterium TaxID=2212470 RepID=A0A849SKS3_UNCEI|nr:coagulation factor 5/8 type domain-containing protein [Candidatus Eisenbacteria bacterium]